MPNKPMFRFLRFLFLLLPIVLFAGGVSTVSGQEPMGTIYIIGEPNYDKFPDVTLTFRVVNTDDQIPALADLSSRLTVYENEQQAIGMPIVTEALENVPSYVIFVVDLGRANLSGNITDQAIRESIHYFWRYETPDGRKFFRDGIDIVQIIARVSTPNEQNRTLLPPTSSLTNFIEAVDGISFEAPAPPPYTKGLIALQEALEVIPEDGPGVNSRAIIFIGRQIEDRRNENLELDSSWPAALATLAEVQGVKLYVFNTDAGAHDAEPIFNTLTQNIPGRLILLESETGLNDNNLEGVYEEITDYTHTFQITYRSPLGTCGDREVALVPLGRLPDTASSSAQVTYRANPCPPAPAVQITSSNSVDRELVQEGGSWHHEPAEVPIVAQVEQNWPFAEATPPALVAAELFVNGESQATISPITTLPLEFSLDISKISSNQDAQIQVVVEDELQSTGQANFTLQINVEATRTPTPAPTPTPIPTVTPPEPPAPPWFLGLLGFISVSIILGLVIGLVTVLYFLRRGEAPHPEPGEAPPITPLTGGQKSPTTPIGKPKKAGDPPLGTLKVDLAWEPLIGHIFEIYDKTIIIGRDPHRAHVRLYLPDTDPCAVSGEHCTLHYQEGKFKITDSSSQGTWVNSKRISSHRPQVLDDKAILVLGSAFPGGAKLLFRYGPAPVEPDSPDKRPETEPRLPKPPEPTPVTAAKPSESPPVTPSTDPTAINPPTSPDTTTASKSKSEWRNMFKGDSS
jgi:hypothetical protein